MISNAITAQMIKGFMDGLDKLRPIPQANICADDYVIGYNYGVNCSFRKKLDEIGEDLLKISELFREI